MSLYNVLGLAIVFGYHCLLVLYSDRSTSLEWRCDSESESCNLPRKLWIL
jgi:hypothetical protein